MHWVEQPLRSLIHRPAFADQAAAWVEWIAVWRVLGPWDNFAVSLSTSCLPLCRRVDHSDIVSFKARFSIRVALLPKLLFTMFSLPDDSGSVQNLDNSGPENSHTSQSSEMPCLSSEASSTVFEQTFSTGDISTGDISQQWFLYGVPGIQPSNEVGEHILEGFWRSASFLEASGSSIHGYHGTRNVENQEHITANSMEPGSEIASLEDAEPNLFLSNLDDGNFNEGPTTSSSNLPRPKNRPSRSYRQREQTE